MTALLADVESVVSIVLVCVIVSFSVVAVIIPGADKLDLMLVVASALESFAVLGMSSTSTVERNDDIVLVVIDGRGT